MGLFTRRTGSTIRNSALTTRELPSTLLTTQVIVVGQLAISTTTVRNDDDGINFNYYYQLVARCPICLYGS
ncbi:hypothetical protein SCLCIDRAFT_1214268 [Scleroderma citrinum Foug A]|uniref:Uncharacterized protein n=1 Tax=Scleroderma citrinum Foug A TaxID=1036808 RepID=A0A0C3DRW0_9AGAM|nr:hypothetical protein SCLCIDRAFT_1214268 [Scleroderma citrinum Foug A]